MRVVGRGVVVAAGVVLAALFGAGSAAAHVEVSVEPAQAGARDAVVTFTAEAESDTAGIASIQVQLPDGIGPGDVALVSGPPGWALTPSPDGYTVSGPPLRTGQPAQYAIKVTQLPDSPTVAFKTVQSYTNGQVDRWITVPEPNGAEPDDPAPMATLAPASTALPPSSESSTSGPDASGQAAPAGPADSAGSAGGDGVPVVVWVVAGVLVVVAGVVGLLIARRRAAERSRG